MKFHDPHRYQVLAGEYALGLLDGPARRRFERYMEFYPFLRREVESWEASFNSVVESLEPVEPPPRVWEGVCESNPALRRAFFPQGLWGRLNIWKPIAVFASALALVLALYTQFGPKSPESGMPSQVAMLQDPKTDQTAWMLSLMPEQKALKITAMHTPPMTTEQSCELWMLRGKDKPPMSLGVLPMSGTMMMPLNDEKMKFLAGAEGLAVSLEPKGGSPTGLPTGPVMFQASFYSI